MCCIPPVKSLCVHICYLEYQGELRVQPKELETYLNLCSDVLPISRVLHICYLMTCSEYVVSDYHTDIYLVITACGKQQRKLVYLKVEDNFLKIAVSC